MEKIEGSLGKIEKRPHDKYRELVKLLHPDRGVGRELGQELNAAKEAADAGDTEKLDKLYEKWVLSIKEIPREDAYSKSGRPNKGKSSMGKDIKV
ncbi:MAG: hypothetical protein ABIE43_02370 [Patescibacteria group bacterium]